MDLNRGWQQLGIKLKKKVIGNARVGVLCPQEMTKINPAFYTLEV